MLITINSLTEDKKEYIKLTNILKQQIYNKVDTKGKLMDTLGLRINPDGRKRKLTTKLHPVVKLNENQIRIHESVHTMGVQRSIYLQID